jgi:hypothetical protein
MRHVVLSRLLLPAGLFFFTFTPCRGQVSGSVTTERDSVYRRVLEEGVLTLGCHFSYVLNSSDIDPLLGNNPRELERLDAFMRVALSDFPLYVRRVSLSGFSSIEGPYAVNERLARDRVRTFKNHLDEAYHLSEQVPVDVAWVPEDWGGLYNMVQDTLFDGREDVLRLIETVDVFRGREEALMRLRRGKVYQWLLSDYFPRLRRVEIRVEYDLQRMLQDIYHRELDGAALAEALEAERARLREEVRLELDASLPRIDTVVSAPGGTFGILGRGEIYSVTYTPKKLCDVRYPAWGIKTNLMHLAGFVRGVGHTTPLLNLSLERFFTPHLSVEAGVAYSEWSYDQGREFQGISAYRLEPRYRLHLPGDRFGLYLGLYGRTGDYGLTRLMDNGQMTNDNDKAQPGVNAQYSTVNYTGDYWDAGLSAGLTVRLLCRLGLEIGLRGGYVSTTVFECTPEGGYNWYERERKYRKVKVTDLNVSLTWRFNK